MKLCLVKLGDARYPVKLDELWLPIWVFDPLKLGIAEYPVKVDEAVYPVKLDEL